MLQGELCLWRSNSHSSFFDISLMLLASTFHASKWPSFVIHCMCHPSHFFTIMIWYVHPSWTLIIMLKVSMWSPSPRVYDVKTSLLETIKRFIEKKLLYTMIARIVIVSHSAVLDMKHMSHRLCSMVASSKQSLVVVQSKCIAAYKVIQCWRRRSAKVQDKPWNKKSFSSCIHPVVLQKPSQGVEDLCRHN